MTPKKIMIIDDDVYIGDMLEAALTGEGYEVARAYSGTEGLLLLAECRPDLILLDLMLPGMNGDEVLKRLSGIPVIVVSAKSDVEDKVSLLSGGAVDYVTKPFNLRELLVRIAVHLRTAPAESNDTLTYGNLTLCLNTREVKTKGGSVRLTRTEFAILKRLMLNPKQVVTKTQILDLVSEDTPDCMESSLKVHISNIRRKLRDISGKDCIEAVWGIGFKMAES